VVLLVTSVYACITFINPKFSPTSKKQESEASKARKEEQEKLDKLQRMRGRPQRKQKKRKDDIKGRIEK
jgi:hypothetical protein